jgi:hypothetical protein
MTDQAQTNAPQASQTGSRGVAYRIEPSRQHRHIYWIDLYQDGVLHECAVLRKDPNGNLFFFQTNHLDEVDKRRLAQLLMDRNAGTVELWDLAANKTLNNGVNALVYFHQLAKILAPNGKILDPRSGQVGTTGSVKV